LQIFCAWKKCHTSRVAAFVEIGSSSLKLERAAQATRGAAMHT
jgi:hypothetical protein